MRKVLLTPLLLLALSGLAPGSAAAAPQISPGSIARAHPLAAAASSLKHEVFGFATSGSLADPTVGYPSWNFSLLSTVAFFGLHVKDDGTFANDSDWAIWNNTAERSAFVNAAHAKGTKVVVTIVLQDFSAGTPHMCAGLAHYSATVGYIVSQVNAQGVDGANIDYEGLNGPCSSTTDSSWARHSYTSFIASLRSALPAGSYLSVDTYASSATDPLGFFDVQALSPSVGSFFVMAYDLEYSNYRRPPLNCASFCLSPTAPLTGYYYTDTSSASQYVAAVGASKVILGVPYYGRKACVASASPNQVPTGAVTADSYLDASTESSDPAVQAGSYAAHRDANDPSGQERWDTWLNTSLKCTRELYWDDVTSLGHKYDLVNQEGLRGVGIWTLNYGGGSSELWSSLAVHFAMIPGAPTSLAVCAGASSASVSWVPATSAAGPITSYQVTANPGGATVTAPGSATYATVTGLTAGTAYTLSVQGINSGGTGVAATTNAVTPPATLPYTGYFSWFDKATAGMVADNIHLLNPGTSASTGCLTFSGRLIVPFTLAAGQETYMTLPNGTIGGPMVVTVSSGPAILASQRVQYYQSFNEVWAMSPSQAATTSYISWFDKASPGMVGDNIHVINLSATVANVTVSLAGTNPIVFPLQAGQETYVTFPRGTIGGPVKITSDQPVLATQRVQYNQSFNEVVARSAAQATTTSYFNWFDRATAGMMSDNIHILNPGATVANVTVSLGPSASPIVFPLQAGQETYVTFTPGHIGGPVAVTSSQPVLASQRVQYYSSFNETASETVSQALATSYVMWFDKATAGMVGDNIHVFNPSGAAVNLTVTLPGASPIVFSLAAWQETYVTWLPGHIGGPVTITSNAPVLAAQRVQYYQSFNEVPASG
jgi:spore germination protein YaaH